MRLGHGPRVPRFADGSYWLGPEPPHWRLLLVLLAAVVAMLLAPFAMAQTVRLTNHAGTTWDGWQRTTVDRKPPADRGIAIAVDQHGDTQEVRYVLGRPIGLDTWAVDLRVTLKPGVHLVVDLGNGRLARVATPPPDASVGPLRANGSKVPPVEIVQDGAAWAVHGRARSGRMLCVDVWLRSYGEPWAHGEAIVTCSNPAVPDLSETLPLGMSLSLDGAVLVPLGGSPGVIVPAGTTMGDGQARAVPFVVVWLDRMQPADWQSLAALWGIGAVGISTLHPTGNALHGPGTVARVLSLHTEAMARLYDWREAPLGIPVWSGRTGAQEDQLYHGEALLPGGAGCERTVYLCALKWANRWCHHLESTGAQLEPSLHPRLVMWDGSWHSSGADRLGKGDGVREPSGNWIGPDVEHWLIQRLYEASRLTGSPACQWLLSAQARVYLAQWTVAPGLYTSQPFATRAFGYEGINAVNLHRALEDRALAERVRERWLDRWVRVLQPHVTSRAIWDPRRDDRLGPGQWWIAWQQALGAYGLDIAGEYFGVPEARQAALAGARVVLDQCWVDIEGRWKSRSHQPVPGNDVAVAAADESFNYFGNSLAVAVVLRNEPENAKARAIWDQLLASARAPAEFSWIAPGVK